MNDRKEINEIKEGLKDLLDRLETLENKISLPPDPFNYFQVELPENGERLYFIDNLQSTVLSKIFDISNMNDVKRFENGLFFETKEEAEQHLKESKLLFKLKQWAKRKNEGWQLDWSDVSQYKYSVDYSGLLDELYATDSTVQKRFNKLPFFESEKIAQECIDLFGDEIKEVFC